MKLPHDNFKVMVVGSGGREHALCWKLAQSKAVRTIFAAPGNGGTAQTAKVQNGVCICPVLQNKKGSIQAY